MIIERLKGFWRDDLELEHRQVIIRNAIEQIEDLREALALEQRTAGAEIERLRAENEKLREALSALAKHCNEMEAQNHDYHTMAEGGAPCISEPLANAYDIMAAAAAIRESGDE